MNPLYRCDPCAAIFAGHAHPVCPNCAGALTEIIVGYAEDDEVLIYSERVGRRTAARIVRRYTPFWAKAGGGTNYVVELLEDSGKGHKCGTQLRVNADELENPL